MEAEVWKQEHGSVVGKKVSLLVVKIASQSQLEAYCDSGKAMEKPGSRMMTAELLVEVVVRVPRPVIPSEGPGSSAGAALWRGEWEEEANL
jgi:hypothetical protein